MRKQANDKFCAALGFRDKIKQEVVLGSLSKDKLEFIFGFLAKTGLETVLGLFPEGELESAKKVLFKAKSETGLR